MPAAPAPKPRKLCCTFPRFAHSLFLSLSLSPSLPLSHFALSLSLLYSCASRFRHVDNDPASLSLALFHVSGTSGTDGFKSALNSRASRFCHVDNDPASTRIPTSYPFRYSCSSHLLEHQSCMQSSTMLRFFRPLLPVPFVLVHVPRGASVSWRPCIAFARLSRPLRHG